MNETHEVPENLDSKLKLGLVLNTGFTVFEFIIGFFSGSLALISDAAHNLTDSMSLLISFFATKISKRKANIDKTYGYGRATVLAAFVNALILLGLAIYIFIEAYKRFQNPQPVEGGLVIIVAFVGIIINGSIAYLFFKSRGDLNIRSAFLNMAMDALASVGALTAGFIIVLTGKTFADPFISIIIGCMLVYSGWSVVKDALHVLLEGTPEGTDLVKIKKAICAMSGVTGIDDLHVWALSTTNAALSAHVIIKKMSLEESIILTKNIKEKLKKDFHIEHATLETQLTEGPHDKERTDEGV